MIKKYFYLIIFLFLLNCSLNPNSKFWTKEKKIEVDKGSITVLLTDKERSLNEAVCDRLKGLPLQEHDQFMR